MPKQKWNPCSILSPVPPVLVTVRDKDGHDNVLTIAWAGTVCSSPAMVSISVKKERFSHHMLMENGDFVINLTNRKLLRAADYCGVRSGRDEDKFTAIKLEKEKASEVNACLLRESPVNIECRVSEVLELGSHDMFLANVVCVDVDEAEIDREGKLVLGMAELVAYTHGSDYEIGKVLGTFGFTVRKKP